jgi:crotonobetainyl-CoA:carnitine CoA-transferase CaiB-like acyl-CoA transferase
VNILAGVRVVDLTMWAFVPSAGGVLAHWGADVIKIESPRGPDPMRLLGGTLEPGGASWFFKHYSRGKRAVALDLATDEGKDILYQLIDGADVFLTSYLPKTRQKLGFDVDDVKKRNPRIIYAKGSGQGPRGPEAERGGYDGATWWCRGTLAQSTMNVTGIDWPSGMIGHGDGMSGMTLAGGICAALLTRERTGESPVVDASLLGTAIWFNGPAIISSGLGADVMAAGATAPREDRHPTTNLYRTKDGRFLILSMLGDFQDEWADLCEHLGRPELIADPRFATPADRAVHTAEAVAIFDQVFATRTLDEWKRALVTTKGVWSPVQTPVEVFDDPQTVANGFLRQVDYATGPVRIPVPPVLFDQEGGDPPPAPDFGQHTDEVLSELGLSAARIAALRSSGIVA